MSIYETAASAVPARFRAGVESEYGTTGREWLAGLPQLLQSLCTRWELEITDSAPFHGYLSLVWRVKHRAQVFALKVTIPSETFTRETAGLLAWDGRSMVRLERHDAGLGAALLQWLDASLSLADVPIDEAVATAGRILTVAPSIEPASASTYETARVQAVTGSRHWSRRNTEFNSPLSPSTVSEGEAALTRITLVPDPTPPRLVNHDLHYQNVMRDGDSNWVCVDPKPIIGAPEYAIAPLIWRRYRDPEDSAQRIRQLCSLAGLEFPLAWDWVLIRSIEYLFWALSAGLTTDPEICRQLIGHLVHGQSA